MEALIANFTAVHKTHDIIPTDLDLGDKTYSVDEAITAISDRTIEPVLDPGDDPSWSKALASTEREYWISGGHVELKSLRDLKVYVLVP